MSNRFYHPIIQLFHAGTDNRRKEIIALGLDREAFEAAGSAGQRWMAIQQLLEREITLTNDPQKPQLLQEAVESILWASYHPHDIQQMLAKLFDVFETHQLTSQVPGSVYEGQYRNHCAVFWDEFLRRGLVMPSQSQTATRIWSSIFLNSSSSTVSEAARWLIDHQIWPDAGGVSPPQSGYSERYNKRFGKNILFWPVNNRDIKLLSQFPTPLLSPGAKCVDDQGRSPLHHATAQLLPPMVDMLLKLGANPALKDARGKLPLDLVRRTSKRVEHIASIQDMLGGKDSRTPEQILILALKILDMSLLKRVLDDPMLEGKHNQLMVQVLSHPFLTSDQSINKKMRKRQHEMAGTLIHKVDPNYQDSQGNNFVHLAMRNGASACVELMLRQSRKLADQQNDEGMVPSEISADGFSKPGGPKYIPDQVGIEKQVAQIYHQLNILWTSKSFPSLHSHHGQWLMERRAQVEHHTLHQSLDNTPLLRPRKKIKI